MSSVASEPLKVSDAINGATRAALNAESTLSSIQTPGQPIPQKHVPTLLAAMLEVQLASLRLSAATAEATH